MLIREALDSDLDDILYVERMAFGQDDEAELVKNLLKDPSAKPILSLIALKNDRAVGHILFTSARLSNTQHPTSVVILAPLAIIPEVQKQGIGSKLIQKGLQILSKSGTDLVFVLGHPEYYPSHGFKPAGQFGFAAPHPIPVENADAWMVKALTPDIMGTVSGKVICSDVLNKPENWQE